MNKYLPLIAVVLGIAAFPLISKVQATSPVSGHKVVIDAGHGGTDPGTTQCDGLYESVANLQIAEALEKKLAGAGATVYMTRTDNVTLSNEIRYDYANSTDGEVLVSIHLNGSTEHSVNGTKGLYAKIFKDKEFTSVLHKQLVADLDVPDLGITNFMSGVTLRFNGPATIQESVYLSNTEECAALKATDGVRVDEIAQSLFEGLETWFSSGTTPVKPGKR